MGPHGTKWTEVRSRGYDLATNDMLDLIREEKGIKE